MRLPVANVMVITMTRIKRIDLNAARVVLKSLMNAINHLELGYRAGDEFGYAERYPGGVAWAYRNVFGGIYGFGAECP